MQKRPLGKTGFSVTQLGFGAAEIGYLKTEREHAGVLLNLLLDRGINVIDTAASYETSEEAIGESISARRTQYVLISKCGGKIPGIDHPAWSPALITATVDRSLQRLGTDHLDVMLLHSCGLDVLQKGEALGALVKAREAGKIKFAGYSGDNEAAVYAAGLPDVAVLETSISIADQANIDQALPLAKQHNIGVLAKRPVANAAWRDAGEFPGFYANYAKPYIDRLAKMKMSPADFGIVGDPKSAWPELALRFTLSIEGISTAIIGTTNPQNVQRNIEYANRGPLPKEVVQKIRDTFHAAQGSDKWVAQT